MRLLPAAPILALAASLAASLGTAPAALASEFDSAIARLAREVAEDLRNAGFARERPAEVYVRPPFDDLYRVVCPALSRRLSQAMRAALPDALLLETLGTSRTVLRQGGGEGQTILNLSWRADGGEGGEERLEIAFLLGDLSSDRIADIGGGRVRVPLSALTERERACLADMAVINRTEVAEETLFVQRSADVFSQEIATIEKGERYRLLGRMPYTGGDWAVVRLLDGAGDDPFAERVGFANVAPTAEERAVIERAERAERERRDAQARQREAREREREAQEREARARREAQAEAEARARRRERQDREERHAVRGPSLVGTWQCQSQRVENALRAQISAQIAFTAQGTYSAGGMVMIYSTFDEQLVNQMLTGEYGLYSYDSGTRMVDVTPQGGVPAGPLVPYRVEIEPESERVIEMINLSDRLRFRCQRIG